MAFFFHRCAALVSNSPVRHQPRLGKSDDCRPALLFEKMGSLHTCQWWSSAPELIFFSFGFPWLRQLWCKRLNCSQTRKQEGGGGGWGLYVLVPKVQGKPFGLATQLCEQNDWTRWQKGVKDDAPFYLIPYPTTRGQTFN